MQLYRRMKTLFVLLWKNLYDMLLSFLKKQGAEECIEHTIIVKKVKNIFSW